MRSSNTEVIELLNKKGESALQPTRLLVKQT
jgi:hypothetical protein